MKKLRIFAASPSDTAAERAKVETVAELLKPLADNLEIVLDVADWRDVVPDMGRPEQVILDQLNPTSWDLFIGILWHRFGTPPAAKDPQTKKDYLAGTEEEFKIAYRLWEQYQKPRLIMYRCVRPIPPDALDPDQFKRVKEFFSQFEAARGEHPGLYQSFDTTESFEKLLLDNLQKLLLDYGEEIRGKPIAPSVVQEFAPKIPDNLPRRAPFFGRNNEMDTVLRALSPEDRTWGVLLDGIGGIGKTALAVEAAYRSKESSSFEAFILVSAKQNILDPGGIRELAPVARTIDEFLNETARVIGQTGIAKLEGYDKRRALLDAMRGRRALLIYDNLETLAKEEQEGLADFLRQLPPGCKAIITSRRRGGEGAVWLRLERLDWEAARIIIETELFRDPQLGKKLRRAGEVRWQELYDATGGSPLALVRTLGLMRVRATLTFDRALEMLNGNRDTDLQRFIFQEALKDLTTNDKAALSALSFFSPSATFEAWMSVANLARNPLETTADRLSSVSLVDVLVGEERYALHSLTRNFVRDELLANGQVANEIGTRFARYWVNYAELYGHGGKESYKTFDRLEAEWTNLDAAGEWLWHAAAVHDKEAKDMDASQNLNDLASAFFDFLWFSGRWDKQAQLSARAYEAMVALNTWSKAGWRAYDVAWIHFNRGKSDNAALWADRASESWKLGEGEYDNAVGLRLQGLLARERSEYEKAAQLAQEALTLFRNLKDDLWISVVLSDLGAVERARKHYDGAKEYWTEALAIAETAGLKEVMAGRQANLGFLALDREHWTSAREWFRKGLPLAREVGRQDLVAANLDGLARAYEAEGQVDAALPLAQEALKIREQLEDPRLTLTRELLKRVEKKIADR